MNNPTKTELITESSNGARERKSQVTHQFELFNKELMNKIGNGQVTIPFSKQEHAGEVQVVAIMNTIFFFIRKNLTSTTNASHYLR